MQPQDDDENSQHPPQPEMSATAAEDDFFEDDIPTQPGLEVLPALNNAFDQPLAPMNNLIGGSKEPYQASDAGIPPEVAQAGLVAPNTLSGGNGQYSQIGKINRSKLAKNLTWLVGISWVLIAVLILSIIFIVLPAAHTLTNVASNSSQKPTQHPTARPTAHPTLIPTPHPTPRPTPSPTPKPTPSPTPKPTPSPTPVPELTVTPTSLNAHTDCVPILNYFKCSVTLSLPQNHAGNLHWSATSSNTITAYFAPAHGTLSAGQQQTVIIFVKRSCPITGNLLFQTQDTKVVVTWSC